PRGVAISLPAERLSVMVNEEDHLRIQAVRSGLDLRGAYDEAEHADNEIERGIDYAFSPRFGYLTACPTNVGTGARFSVMLHLPALRMIGEIEKVKHAADDMGLAVRGYYGEGSDTTGDFFQISNQTTLGKSEGVLMHEMEHEIVPRVVEYERHARGVLLGKRRSSTEDEVHRALGTLRSARLIETDEAMQLLGRVRLGVVLGLIGGGEAGEINHLMLLSHPAHLQRTLGREISQADRRLERATLLRSRLSSFG
ncbi:MAG: ATP--guanido phosphotransferase, partial [Planctomycetota bacterium]